MLKPMLTLYLVTDCLTRVSFRKAEVEKKKECIISTNELTKNHPSQATMVMPKVSCANVPRPSGVCVCVENIALTGCPGKILWLEMPVDPTFQQCGSAVGDVPLSRVISAVFQ